MKKPTRRIRTRKKIEESVLSLARARVREAYAIFDTVAVSFSGGKDSTAVLNLTLEAAEDLGRLPVPVFFYDEEAIPYETEEYVRRVSRDSRIDFRWLCLPIQHRNACTRKSPYWYPWAPEDKERWVRALPPEAITAEQVRAFPQKIQNRPTLQDSVGLLFDPARDGRVGMMLGIRADESTTRSRSILMVSKDSRPYIRAWEGGYTKGNMSKVYPIYDWKTADVWTAPSEFGWDYNRAYDLMDKLGITPSAQRVAPPYGEEPLAALWMFAAAFPDIWDRMSCRVPGAATAARYSRTELYSFKDSAKKPHWMTYKEYIRALLMKHPEEYRWEIARRINRWIANHQKKTKDPLAGTAPHPVTYISWKFLIDIAVRGDYKDRRQAKATKDDAPKMLVRYKKEIKEMAAMGDVEAL